MTERIIYEVEVPENERSLEYDIPEAYRVAVIEGLPECMVYGRYSKHRERPEWVPNVSARWLVKHLVDRLGGLVELKEWHDSYD